MIKGNDTGVESLPSDDVYRVLGNRRRRFVLEIMVRQDGPTDIGTLAERIAALENDRSPEEITENQRKSVYAGLHQRHLPLMEETGFIRATDRWDRIELTRRAVAITRRLTGTVSGRISWYRLYAGLAGLGVVFLLGEYLRLFPFTAIPEIAYTGILVAALVILSIAHVYAMRSRASGALFAGDSTDLFSRSNRI